MIPRAKSIRLKCLDCATSAKEVRECIHKHCQLYPYRMKAAGLPSGCSSVDRKRAINGYCLSYCCLDQPKELKLCPVQSCPLWPYRYVKKVQKTPIYGPHLDQTHQGPTTGVDQGNKEDKLKYGI